MRKKKILFFTGFVGGRGSSKAVYWLYQGLKERGYEPIIVSESIYLYKLDDLNLKPDFIIKRKPADSDRFIYQKCEETLSKINFDYMVSFGPRTYGPYYAFKKRIPYAISEYSTPLRFEKFPSKYINEIYKKASLYMILAPFPFKYPKINGMNNIVVSSQPYPYQRIQEARKIRKISIKKARQILSRYYPEIRNISYDLLLFLNINDEYVNPFNIYLNNLGYKDEYQRSQNGFLSIKALEQTLSFVTRLIAGLETNFKGKTLIYMLEGVQKMVQPVLNQCQKVKAFSRLSPFIDLELDLLLKRAADVNICRESIGDNSCELYLIGKPAVTSVVPTNFMNEDLGLKQARNLGTCFSIPYDDLLYVQKLISFTQDKRKQKKISKEMIRCFDLMWKKFNYYELLINSIEKS